MDSISTAQAEPTSEHPALKCTRLSRELAKALADDTDGGSTVILVYPAGSTEYPIQYCYDEQFAAMSHAMFKYRDACQAMAAAGSDCTAAIRSEVDETHDKLLAAFAEVRS